MAGLYFKVGSDYENVIRLRTEIEKLKSTLSGMDGNTPPATLRAMEVQLAKNTKELDTMVSAAAKAGNELDQNFKKKIFDSSMAVNRLSEDILDTKEKIDEYTIFVRRLSEYYKTLSKSSPNFKVTEKELADARKNLELQKDKLKDLQLEQGRARISVKKLKDEYALFNKESASTVDVSRQIETAMGNMAKKVFSVVAAKEFVSQVIEVRAEMQMLNKSFEVLLGSKDKADLYVKEIKDYALVSPLSVSDVSKAAQTLLGFNVEAEKTIPIIKSIGDISMGDSQKFGSLTLAFSQMSAAGRLMGQDLNQMINAGFNPLQVISEKTGKSIAQLKKEMESGAISSQMVADAFSSATAEGGKFHGMIEKSADGIRNAQNQLTGAIQDTLNSIGESQEGIIKGSYEVATSLVQNYDKVGRVIAGLIVTYGAYRTALMLATIAENGHSVSMLLTRERILLVRKAQQLLNATMLANPYVLLATIVAGFAATMWVLHDSTTAAEKAQKQLNKEQEEAARKKQELTSKTDSLISKINSETESVYSQVKAYKELIKLFPELGNMTFEEFKSLPQDQQKKTLSNISEKREVEDAIGAYEADLKRIEELKKQIKEVGEEVTYSQTSSNVNKLQRLRKELEEINNLAKLHKEEIDKIKEAQWEANTPVEEKVKHYEDVKKRLVEEKDELEKTLTKSEDIASVWMGLPDIINNVKLDALNKQIDETTGKINSLTGKDVSVVKNKSYWEKQKQEAEAARDALDISEKNSERWNKYTREIQQAQKEIAKYDTTGKADNEAAKRLKLQQELSRFILDSELKLQSARVAAMEDGKAKRIALAEQETKDTIAAIQKEKEEYQKKVKEIKGKESPAVLATFDNRELAAKEKERADIARIEKEYAEEYKQRVKTLTDVFLNEEQRKLSSIKERYDKERKWANEQLKTGGMTKDEHKSYTTNIDKAQQQETYRALLDNLNDYKQKEKDLRDKWDTDIAVAVESKDAYLVAKLMEGKQKALSALNGQMLQESDEWQQLFRNLDNLTVQQLEKLSNTIKEKAKGLKLNPIDAQAVTNSLKEVDEKIRTMNPFGLLSKHLKEYKKAEDDVTKKNALKEMFRDTAASIDMVKGGFDAVVGGLNEMGLAGDEATQQLLSDLSNLMGSASQLATSIASANPVGIIQGSIGVLTSVFNIFNNDKRHEKKIKALQDQVDALDKSYEKLGKAIDKAYSKDASQLIDQQNKLLEQQKVLIQQQIREEQDKKKTDKDRIKDWQEQIEEINDVIADNKEKAVDAIFGEDLKSAIDNFANAQAEAWASGEDRAESAKDTVKKMMRQMVTESIKAATESSGAMEKIRDKLKEFYADNVLSGWEQDYIYNMAEELQKEIDRQFGWADSLMKDEVEEPEKEEVSENSLKGAYAKASQESIDLLAGQTGAVRILLEDIRGGMQPIREQMRLIYEMQSRGWEDVRAIRELSDKVEKNTDRIAENTREIKEVAGKISENTRGTVDALEGTINVKVKM
ncbi:tape measure protein [Parabacteroides merdae]|uniref:tape measure protein n=1 Tax=Parabacteroides merdae TaxID=46503 RepID=UPI002174DB05|nr:tape measure protein [Parabacteroides merdae]